MSIRFINPLTRLNVRQQFVLLFLILVSPVFVLNGYANTKAEDILKEHVTGAYEELNKQNHVLINRDIDTISRIMSSMIQHPMTQGMLAEPAATEFDRVLKYTAMSTLLGSHSVGLFDGEAITYFLFVHDPYHRNPFAPAVPDINRRNNASSVFYYADEAGTPWLEAALAAKGKGVLALIDDFGPRGDQMTLAYLRAVNSITNGRTVIGVLVATKMDKKIEEAFGTVSLPEGGEMVLTDWSDRILAATNGTMGQTFAFPKGLVTGEAMQETASMVTDEYIYVVHTRHALKQKLVYTIPTQSLLQQQSALKLVIHTLSIVYSVFAIVVMTYFWRSLMNPIRKLAGFARSHEPGKQLALGPPGERNDELGVLIHSVQGMVDRINTMIHEQYAMELRQKEAQLQLLYQQINPHLLYNTLESIYWKSSLEGRSDAAEMIKELSKLMRISLSRGRELITIEEELDHARAYTTLQQMRYEYGFAIRWEIEPAVLPYQIPKITLQPLIENAVMHGVIRMGEDGEIVVSARNDAGEIRLMVEDNGYKPADIAGIHAILADDQSQHGYGIRNVHQRLRLHFGPEYGLRYEARQPEGVRVSVIIPQRLGEEGALR